MDTDKSALSPGEQSHESDGTRSTAEDLSEHQKAAGEHTSRARYLAGAGQRHTLRQAHDDLHRLRICLSVLL